ncbi:helix-turn-helix domain-containing protein [Bacillus sp. AFS040349]|uniref:helix-turn-helix domain-containing protein n=1 Tax=Bacillus sp. AFS040349 TaxID=2033502 RepID=UPI000BFE2224|nr:helix-turn-helix transcriptional regulator [Bacillus sp. AFS040349]PGT83252.1 hypothetical protein COD11_13025 [Bacillus sp. AFS040349]
MGKFGEKLRELRFTEKVSIDDLVENINQQYGTTISKSMVSRYENDLGEPKIDTAITIAKYFGKNLDYFLEERSGNEEATDINGPAIRAIVTHIKNKNVVISDEKKKDILKYLDFILMDSK